MRRQSSTNSESTSVDELVKGKSKQEDHGSLLTMCEVPELPVRGYLQDADFMKREFSIYTPGTFSVAAEHEHPATQGETSTANQVELNWQDKSDYVYMALVRRPEDTETSDYMTLVGSGLKKMALILLKIMVAKYNSTVTMQVGAFYKQNKINLFSYPTCQFEGDILIRVVYQRICERLPYTNQSQCKL